MIENLMIKYPEGLCVQEIVDKTGINKFTIVNWLKYTDKVHKIAHMGIVIYKIK